MNDRQEKSGPQRFGPSNPVRRFVWAIRGVFHEWRAGRAWTAYKRHEKHVIRMSEGRRFP